jgi:hypothetical protein
MNPNAAPNAVRQGKQSVTGIVATAMAIVPITLPDAKCSLQHVLNAARILKYRSNRVKVDRCIAVIATVK